MKLRAWAEFISPREVSRPEVVSLLKRYGVSPCLAMPHGSPGEYYSWFLHVYNQAGLEPALWPTLADEQGYWPSERNWAVFSAYVKEIFAWAERENVTIPWLAVDLEPPYYQHQEISAARGMQKAGKMWKIYRSNMSRKRFRKAVKAYQELQAYINERGCRTLVPALPVLEMEIKRDGNKLQNLLETPVGPVNWDVVSFMQYNTLFAGMSRGSISLEQARWYLYLLCLNMKEKLGKRAGVSLGLTSTGKLGDEPYYREPEEMLPDVETALAAGMKDIAVFSLEGILNSAHPESWLEMLRMAKPRIPARSWKVEVFRKTGEGMLRLLPGAVDLDREEK